MPDDLENTYVDNCDGTCLLMEISDFLGFRGGQRSGRLSQAKDRSRGFAGYTNDGWALMEA